MSHMLLNVLIVFQWFTNVRGNSVRHGCDKVDGKSRRHLERGDYMRAKPAPTVFNLTLYLIVVFA